jgi:environmental stress-induced protein Ves
VQIIRQASFRTTPWKNGGGVTHEALRYPAEGAPFRWRLSVATIGSSGPFSDFSGYRRHMALLRGAGLQLRFADGTVANLREVGELVAFDGGLAAHCELLAGECTDLNFMISTALPAPRVGVTQLRAACDLHAASQHSLLIVAIDAAVIVSGAGVAEEILAPWDLALATSPDDRIVHLSPVDESRPAQVFLVDLMDTG